MAPAPILLLNGYAATSADWDPTFLEALRAGGEVITPDTPAGAETIEAMAESMLALLDERGIGSCPVTGWSMGGFVAQELARVAPERVDALALIATDPGGSDAVRCDDETWKELCSREGSPREQASRLISLLFPPGFAEVVDRDFGDVVASAREALDPAALDAEEAAMAAWHEGETKPRPDVPILAAAGSEDRVIPPANAPLVAGERGHVEIFDRGGHAFMAQQPDRLAGLLLSFFSRA